MSSLKRILVTGATGKQGGALISALLSSPPAQPFDLVALTRNSKSPRAQALAQKPNVSVLEGDLDDVPSIFKKAGDPFYGVFSVQTPLKPAVEEKQGKALVDAAIANGVEHFIYASVERGGVEKSDKDPTPIPHFISKFNVEKHLIDLAAKREPQMKWTIIRPVAFMDNITPDFFGRVFNSIWQMNGTNEKLQLVSSRDIGILAAEMFKDPTQYSSQSISFATDEISPLEAAEIFKRVTGKDLPYTYTFVARIVKFLAHEQLGIMFNWFKSDGFGADPKKYITKYPQMQNLEKWLRESSAWKTQ